MAEEPLFMKAEVNQRYMHAERNTMPANVTARCPVRPDMKKRVHGRMPRQLRLDTVRVMLQPAAA